MLQFQISGEVSDGKMNILGTLIIDVKSKNLPIVFLKKILEK